MRGSGGPLPWTSAQTERVQDCTNHAPVCTVVDWAPSGCSECLSSEFVVLQALQLAPGILNTSRGIHAC